MSRRRCRRDAATARRSQGKGCRGRPVRCRGRVSALARELALGRARCPCDFSLGGDVRAPAFAVGGALEFVAALSCRSAFALAARRFSTCRWMCWAMSLRAGAAQAADRGGARIGDDAVTIVVGRLHHELLDLAAGLPQLAARTRSAIRSGTFRSAGSVTTRMRVARFCAMVAMRVGDIEDSPRPGSAERRCGRLSERGGRSRSPRSRCRSAAPACRRPASIRPTGRSRWKPSKRWRCLIASSAALVTLSSSTLWRMR